MPDDKNVYELGLVAKLFNSDTRAYTINGIGYTAGPSSKFELVGRGSWILARLAVFPPHAQSVEDRYIKAGSEGYYKLLLPIGMMLTPANGSPDNSGPITGIHMLADWTFTFGKQHLKINPEYSATFERPITLAEWEALTRPGSVINLENLNYQPL